MGVKAEGTPRVCHREGIKTPASLGYPPSVFNKNSTLKGNLGAFGLGSRMGKIRKDKSPCPRHPLSHRSCCGYFSIYVPIRPKNFPEWPVNFVVSTIRQVIWLRPGVCARGGCHCCRDSQVYLCLAPGVCVFVCVCVCVCRCAHRL